VSLPFHDEAGEEAHAQEDRNVQEVGEGEVSVIRQKNVGDVEGGHQDRRAQPARNTEPDAAQGDGHVVEMDDQVMGGLPLDGHEVVPDAHPEDQEAQDRRSRAAPPAARRPDFVSCSRCRREQCPHVLLDLEQTAARYPVPERSPVLRGDRAVMAV
jgi:hypothetical protein